MCGCQPVHALAGRHALLHTSLSWVAAHAGAQPAAAVRGCGAHRPRRAVHREVRAARAHGGAPECAARPAARPVRVHPACLSGRLCSQPGRRVRQPACMAEAVRRWCSARAAYLWNIPAHRAAWRAVAAKEGGPDQLYHRFCHHLDTDCIYQLNSVLGILPESARARRRRCCHAHPRHPLHAWSPCCAAATPARPWQHVWGLAVPRLAEARESRQEPGSWWRGLRRAGPRSQGPGGGGGRRGRVRGAAGGGAGRKAAGAAEEACAPRAAARPAPRAAARAAVRPPRSGPLPARWLRRARPQDGRCGTTCRPRTAASRSSG